MINIRMQHKDVEKLSPHIAVIGVGGAGGNAVNNMIEAGLQGCEFVVCNTDAQALEGSRCETKVQLGVEVTGGLGAGAKPEIGRAAAEESLDDIARYLEGANMAFITAGMGGGTGTGAAPVIARACREMNILTVGVVTRPFHFEGAHRMRLAEAGIEEMQQYVDTLIVIPNQNLFRIANEKTTFAEAFRMADSVLQSAVRGVTDLMVMPGMINLDFADIRSAMQEMGKAMMGTGEAHGDRRAIEAAEAAINNPLLDDVSMKGARGVIINVTGGYDISLFEVDEACNRIRDEVDPNANIIFGSTFDETLEGMIRISVVATGIDSEVQKQAGRTGASSGSSSSGGQERKLERAQPNTASAAAERPRERAAVAPAAPVRTVPVTSAAVHIPTQGPVTAPAMSQAAAARKAEEPEHEMFEQQIFEPVVPAPAPEPVSYRPQPAPQPAALRGAVYNNSFIPPLPAEPEQSVARYGAGYGPDLGNAAAQKTARVPHHQAEPPVQNSMTPGLTLKPPVPGGMGAATGRKRSQSLFERFTSPLRHGHRDDGQHTAAAQPSAESLSAPLPASSVDTPAAPAPSLRAPQRETVRQGSLNIDAPAGAAAGAEEELDIPAFLRRQAN